MAITKSAPSKANINTIRKLAGEGNTLEFISRVVQVKPEAVAAYAKSANIEITGSPDTNSEPSTTEDE